MFSTDHFELPHVIVHCAMSIDGHLTIARGVDPPVDWDIDLYRDLRRRLGADACMTGSESILVAKAPNPIEDLRPEIYKNANREESIFIIPDSRGRVRWTGWQRDPWLKGLVVLCSQITPSSYIEHLRKEEIPHIVAGEDHVDLRAALRHVKTGYKVTRVVCFGGGGLNGALLQAGLVNEVSVQLVPFVVGRISTPTLFEIAELKTPHDMVRLQLINCERIRQNFVWLHYRVVQ